MNALLFTLLLGGLIKVPETRPAAAMAAGRPFCTEALRPVIVTADDGSARSAAATGRIVAELRRELRPCSPVEAAVDAMGPAGQPGFFVSGVSRDLVMVEPRAPAGEAIEARLFLLFTAQQPRTLIVIAHGHSYPPAATTGRLLALARRSKTTVHAIHLAARGGRGGGLKHPGRLLKKAISSLAPGSDEPEACLARGTPRPLRILADATGGIACAAAGERNEIDCARAVAARILSFAR